jgi:uncharacterized protein (TIGR00255 family)
VPHSMTGFAASEIAVGAVKLVWEVRSVNHRYLDLGFRLPEELRVLEAKLRKLAGDSLKRGKVDCTLKMVSAGSDAGPVGLDSDRVAALAALEQSVIERFPAAARLGVVDILRWPGMLRDQGEASEALLEPAAACFVDALTGLATAREREGARLAELLVERLDAIDVLMGAIDEQLVRAAPRYRDRLLERLEKLDVEANPERLEQELALIAQRADVSEEADRLRGHLSEIRTVLGQAEPVGRRLDFLIQELNREANTLSSKVQDEELAHRAVDLKVLIEQMREQVQNLE